MRFALRTLVPVFAAVVVVTITTAFSSRPAVAQERRKIRRSTSKRRGRRAARRLRSPHRASEAADPQPLLAKGEAALKAGDFAAAMAAFNDAGKAAQQASQARRRSR